MNNKDKHCHYSGLPSPAAYEQKTSKMKLINKYYKNTGLNMRIVEISILEINRKAFVRNNPNYLYAGKTLKIPSVNEMMNLVRKDTDKNQNNGKHIYFFGGFWC